MVNMLGYRLCLRLGFISAGALDSLAVHGEFDILSGGKWLDGGA